MTTIRGLRRLGQSRLFVAVLTAVATAGVVGGISYASIPDPSGVIHGCYEIKGTNHPLSVINSAVTASCPKGYTSLDWNQTGPQGPTGPTGPGFIIDASEGADSANSVSLTDAPTVIDGAGLSVSPDQIVNLYVDWVVDLTSVTGATASCSVALDGTQDGDGEGIGWWPSPDNETTISIAGSSFFSEVTAGSHTLHLECDSSTFGESPVTANAFRLNVHS